MYIVRTSCAVTEKLSIQRRGRAADIAYYYIRRIGVNNSCVTQGIEIVLREIAVLLADGVFRKLVGKKVVIVYNLKPAKLCGVESRGMILCAEKDGKVCVVSPENGEIPDGATVR